MGVKMEESSWSGILKKKKKKQGKRMSEAEGKQLVVKMSDTLQGQGQIIWRNYFLINN